MGICNRLKQAPGFIFYTKKSIYFFFFLYPGHCLTDAGAMIGVICFLGDNCYFMFSENAARTIQSHIKGLVVRRKFLRMVDAVTLLQTVFRAWLNVRQEAVFMKFTTGQIYDFSSGMQLII